MEKQEKIDYERAKMKNCILEKENEILLEKIGAFASEKKELLNQIEQLKRKPYNKIIWKIKRIIRRK